MRYANRRPWKPPSRIRLRDEWEALRRGLVRFHVLSFGEGGRLAWSLYQDRPWRYPAVFFGYLFRTLGARFLTARSV